MRGISILAAVAAALAVLAAPARAMPGDPGIANIAPLSFESTVLVRGALDVSFSCPAYRTGQAGMIADGDAADYSVRLAVGNTGPDGRIPGPGSPLFFSEAPAQPIAGTPNCIASLPIPNTRGPSALYFGGVDWQVARRCPGCNGDWELGAVSWVILRPNIEGTLAIPPRIYAGYLTRFTYTTVTDLSGASVGLQWFDPRHGWSDLGRTPFVPGQEMAFFAKLPAGRRLLRIEAHSESDRVLQLGLPRQDVMVRKPGRRRATGHEDDGSYFSSVYDPPVLRFQVVGAGHRLRRLKALVPITCAGAPPPTPTATAVIRSARIAPDGTVTARSPRAGGTSNYVTLTGSFRHHRFAGTVTTAFGDCSGSLVATAGKVWSHPRAAVRARPARGPRP